MDFCCLRITTQQKRRTHLQTLLLQVLLSITPPGYFNRLLYLTEPNRINPNHLTVLISMLRQHQIIKCMRIRAPSSLFYSNTTNKVRNNNNSTRWMASNSNSNTWKRNGTPELIIGTTLLTLLGVDYYLQTKQDESRQEIMSTLQQTIRNDLQKEQRAVETNENETSTSTSKEQLKIIEPLFPCKVRKIPKLFDGSKSLMGVTVGDEVKVLEERVGPDGMYHLCRLEKIHEGRGTTAVTVGWFPISCLEKLK
jgi:hypothetical protein